jgi:hypothetical protein
MDAFLSHISEEATIAQALKGWLESTFAGQIKVFVSSDPDDLPAGKKWLNEIENALDKSDLLLILYSPASKNRPWISFEAGCAWIKKTPIIPICHSGLTVSELGYPLSTFQALSAEDKQFAEKLIRAIAKEMKIEKLPRISYDEMQKEIVEACRKAASGSGRETVEPKAVEIASQELSAEQTKILGALAYLKDRGDKITYEKRLAEMCGMKITVLRYHIASLVEGQFVYRGHGASGAAYTIKDKGITYLMEGGLLK